VGREELLTKRDKTDGQPFVTDGGNYIYECAFGSIEEPELLDEALNIAPGVVEHGLFLGLADLAIIGLPAGVEVIEAGFDADEV
jgi:ribose 5-phosphate isomerase A